MSIEEAQNNFTELLHKKGINIAKESLFFSNDSKRLTSTGNIYASMLKISNEIHQYSIQTPFSREFKEIIENNTKSFYYISLNNKEHYSDTIEKLTITIYEENFDIKIQLAGGFEQWWNKVKGEYYG